MDFTEPQPLTDVLARLDAKTPIGSVMRSADWQAMPQELRDSAFFSAGVTNAQFLAQQKASIRDMISRAREKNESGQSMWKMDRGQFVKQLRVMGEAVGIAHPDGRKGGINEKDITDPLSIARLKLVVNTQLEMAYGQGQYLAAMDADVLQEWPAWELVRITPKKAPRDWDARWVEAANAVNWEGVSREAFKQGRKIALKTSGIWIRLSRFGKPHSPFDFNSGMGVEEVDRDTTEQLGLMSMPAMKAAARKGRPVPAAPSQQILPAKLRPITEGLEASVKGLGEVLLEQLQQVLGKRVTIEDDTAKWNTQTAPDHTDTVVVQDAKPEPPRMPEQIPARPKAPKKKAGRP